MLLTIDVGNTNMVFGIFEGERLAGSFRLRTESTATSDEIGLLACTYFERFGWKPGDVEAVVIASVVPPVMYALTSAMVKYFGKTPLVVDDALDPGLPYGALDSDERLGPDRSVACIAAMEKYGKPLVVLDFGTATTVDAVDKHGVYQGGCIAAGLPDHSGRADIQGLHAAGHRAFHARPGAQRHGGGAHSGRCGRRLCGRHGVSDSPGQGGAGRRPSRSRW